jgi:cation diffusion facilitator CzcD-associated flavoprotein CzcO
MEYIKLEHQVIGATWSDADSKWDVEVQDTKSGGKARDRCDILISATGVLK